MIEFDILLRMANKERAKQGLEKVERWYIFPSVWNKQASPQCLICNCILEGSLSLSEHAKLHLKESLLKSFL